VPRVNERFVLCKLAAGIEKGTHDNRRYPVAIDDVLNTDAVNPPVRLLVSGDNNNDVLYGELKDIEDGLGRVQVGGIAALRVAAAVTQAHVGTRAAGSSSNNQIKSNATGKGRITGGRPENIDGNNVNIAFIDLDA